MERLRILGLVLVFVSALVAIDSAGASAHFEWYECARVTGGRFEKGCSKEGGRGGFEPRAGVGKGKPFKGKSGPVILSTKILTGRIKVECANSKDEGHAANIGGQGYLFDVKAVYKKCSGFGGPCSSWGAKAGEIRVNTLAGPLGRVSELERGIHGADLASEVEPGGAIVEFNCPFF